MTAIGASFTGVVPGRATGRLPIPRRPPRRSPTGRARRLAELLALTAFAIAQPVLDVTGRSPDFFLYRQATAGEMCLLVAAVVLGPPLLLWAVELAVRRAAGRVHQAFVVVLFAAIGVEVGKKAVHLTGPPLVALAVLAGVAMGLTAARSKGLRQTIVYATPAPLVFALLFALTSPAGTLLRPAAGTDVVATAGKRPPVVVVFLDEFPLRSLLDDAGAIDARLFPNFANLASASTWYPNATGVIGWTQWAIPAMLTGRFPEKAVAPHYSAYPRNLFTVLARSYDVKAYESITRLCPPSVCASVPAGHSTGLGPLLRDTVGIAREIVSPYPPPVREGDSLVDSGAVPDDAPTFGSAMAGQPDRVTSFLDALDRPTGAPPLTFLHVLLPHVPFRYLPSGQTYPAHSQSFPLSRAMESDQGRRNQWPGATQVTQQRLLLQAVYTDGLIGQLMKRLKADGAWRDALVVVTADHGEGFSPGERSRMLDAHNTADLAYVPLFVKLPRQREGKVDRRNAMHVDLLPTIADVLAVRLPFPVDGVSLLGPPRPTPDKVWYDRPGKMHQLDVALWGPKVLRGIAPHIARPELGVDGLYAVGPSKDLVGTRVGALDVGAPTSVVAKSRNKYLAADVDIGSGTVPALIWGDLDRPVGDEPTWLAIAVNGTVAGAAYAAPSRGDGSWHYVGLACPRYFVDGRNDIRLYVVDGSTLHRVAYAT